MNWSQNISFLLQWFLVFGMLFFQIFYLLLNSLVNTFPAVFIPSHHFSFYFTQLFHCHDTMQNITSAGSFFFLLLPMSSIQGTLFYAFVCFALWPQPDMPNTGSRAFVSWYNFGLKVESIYVFKEQGMLFNEFIDFSKQFSQRCWCGEFSL